MNIKYWLIIIILISFHSIILLGQDTTFTGQVIDTLNSAIYANIFNYSKKINSKTSIDGKFIIYANSGDTIIVTSKGYLYKKLLITPYILQRKSNIISLDLESANLAEAYIFPFKDYTDFRKHFINAKLIPSQLSQLNLKISKISSKEGQDAYDSAVLNRIIVPYSNGLFKIYTRYEKEIIKLSKIKKIEHSNNEVYSKFNPEMIKIITGISNQDSISNFMKYCNFSNKYIIESNILDIINEIEYKYLHFVKNK